jgi:hypothetical protein
MSSVVSICAWYSKDPDEVFETARSFESLRRALRGLVVYEGLPETGEMIEGANYKTDIWFWRLVPVRNHVIQVERVNIADRHILTRETHAGIQSWTHCLMIERAKQYSIWLDRIEIEAGFQPPLVAWFARHVYVQRHRRQHALMVRSRLTGQPAR